MTNLTIGITPPALGRPARLRADGIRVQDLVQLGRTLAEGDDRARRLIDALEYLGQISHDAREGELDEALGDVATLAHLDAAVMDLSAADVRQLAEQATDALPALRPVRHPAVVSGLPGELCPECQGPAHPGRPCPNPLSTSPVHAAIGGAR